MTDSIQERFNEVQNKIILACQKVKRSPKDVHLVVVTKGQNAEAINQVIRAGAKILGENYPEETIEKISQVDQKMQVKWHMIGHIQSRKIRYLDPTFSMIHSIDRLEIAQKVNQSYTVRNKTIDVLIEVNIVGEESKYGFNVSSMKEETNFLKQLEVILTQKNLNPIGLMTMPPFASTERQNVECYNICRELLNKIQYQFGLKYFKQLSMGTSGDYVTAIECGATYVRVGEAIMGKRNYK